MAYKKTGKQDSRNVVKLGGLNPKQKLFTRSRTLYTAYGGARGGGKSHVVRWKATGGALNYPGLRVLIVRHEYPELEQTMILPMQKLIPPGVATYNSTMRMFFFPNGSVIKFGHFSGKEALEYQGQEWDWIFMDEATQFEYDEFLTLGACLRGTSDVPRRMYLTCNPGGVGHMWVKRLFVDREFQEGEDPADYSFIQATVEDNPQLLKSSPGYLKMLEQLPDDVRAAWRYGDWNALGGNFFPEFTRATHVEAPYKRIPGEWRLYRAFDYGLDMFACLWIAIDFQGRAHVYREVQQPGLIVSQAANLMLAMTPPDEHITATFAPPDMWTTQKDTGRTMADVFQENGVGILRAPNNRVQGWANVKEWLKPMIGDKKETPGLLVCSECLGLIRNLAAIQHDDKNPSDCAVKPHDITHICDALRYFCASRVMGAEKPEIRDDIDPLLDNGATDYDDVMTGGEITEDYMNF